MEKEMEDKRREEQSVNVRIKNYLETNGISQTFVANKIGMSIRSFNALVNGHTKCTAEVLIAITSALNLPAEFFLKNSSLN